MRHRLVLCLAALVAVSSVAAPAQASAGHRPARHHQIAPRLVAMGDSFAAGEGTLSYLPGTDTADNQCHRSGFAYGSALARRAPFRPGRLVACSGATTADVVQPSRRYPTQEPAQVAALGRSTRFVTLGIGGNDLGFSSVMTACVLNSRSPQNRCSQNQQIADQIDLALAAMSGPFADNGVLPVTTLLTAIQARAAHARILVVGYPRLFGSPAAFPVDATVPSGRSCRVNPAAPGLVIDADDAAFVNRTTDELNAVLEEAVLDAQDAGIRATYVTPSSFRGHGLCDTAEPWINGVVLSPTTGAVRPESFHPTRLGQAGYLRDVLTRWGRLTRR